MKTLTFLATAYTDFMAFPTGVVRKAGFELYQVQIGRMPSNFKSMQSIGSGVCEIRLKDKDGIYRVIYTAKIADAVYVLHAFVKKTQKTPKQDIDLAKARQKALLEQLK